MFAVSECRGVYQMPAPNGTADYTPHLLAAMATRTSANEPRDLYFPPGEYHFYGPLPTEDYAEFFDAFKWFAAPTAATRQHRVEPGNSHPMRRSVQFKIHLDDESDVWMHIARPYRLGPISITGGIAFSLVAKGSLISIGDPTVDDGGYASIRGLKIECDLDRELTHYSSLNVDGEGNSWLEDKGADGFVLNRANQSFGLRLSHCYDVQLDVNTRGLKYGVINIRCDRPRGDVIGLSNGRTLVETNQQAVPSQWTNVWEENSMIGSIVSGHVADFRGETNAAGATPPGAYSLPSTVNWSVAAGGTSIGFSSWDGIYDARDYFEPWTVIKVDPGDASEPERFFLVTTVEANSVGIWDATSKSYVPRAIGGTGANITRYFGIPLTCLGSRCDVATRSTVENFLSIPTCAIVPHTTPMRVAGNSAGRGWDANSAQLPIIVASSVGVQEQVFGGVDMIGTADVPPHPLVNSMDAGPRFERRTREAVYDLAARTFIAMPGRGVSAINDCARRLTFHPLTDEDTGEKVYGYRPTDASPYGWEVRDPRLQKNKLTTLLLRVYNPDLSNDVDVSAYGGSGTAQIVPAVPGWSDVAFAGGDELPAADMTGDGNGAVIYLNATDPLYITRVWITQS